jgi:putative ABC transport system permease protein
LSIRRAVGARRQDLFLLVIGSSLVTGLIAATLALIAVSFAITFVLPHYIPASSAVRPPALPWTAVLNGCLSALGTAVAGGLLPALRASRVEIAAALRD